MVKITELSVSYGEKRSHNYDSVSNNISWTIELTEKDLDFNLLFEAMFYAT
ncbi:MAG: hypothetical protein GF317_24060 [Candidatus Lokiarchaeota archaeon]|nr:hypothetical protein [Candidatus Lokiarchaeota archaeon]MBD3202448.1 hypothetical protein [Candidatus Lokiarchaeota archaeon]